MKFRVFGTEVYISFLFAAVISVMLATDRTGLALPSLFAVFMHEIGHLFAMWLLDCSPKGIKLIPASVQISRSITQKYKNDIIIAFLGPLVNFVLFLVLYLNYILYGNQTILYYALLNLLIGCFNFMPVKGLDGGTILFAILAKRINYDRAVLIVRLVTLLVAVVAIFFAVYLTFRGKVNISLYIISIYLVVMTILKT